MLLAFSYLLTLREASCRVVSYLAERPIWQGTEGIFWPTGDQDPRPSV